MSVDWCAMMRKVACRPPVRRSMAREFPRSMSDILIGRQKGITASRSAFLTRRVGIHRDFCVKS